MLNGLSELLKESESTWLAHLDEIGRGIAGRAGRRLQMPQVSSNLFPYWKAEGCLVTLTPATENRPSHPYIFIHHDLRKRRRRTKKEISR